MSHSLTSPPPRAPHLRVIRSEDPPVYKAGGPTTPPAAAPPRRPSQASIAKACGVTAAGLLGLLVERAGPSGVFVATMPELALEYGYSDRRVRQLVAALEAAGFLGRETAYGPGGLACGVRFTVPESLRTNYPEIYFSHETTPEMTPETSCVARAGAANPDKTPFVSYETHGTENDGENGTPLYSPKGEKTKRKTPVPEDFVVTGEMRAWAIGKGVPDGAIDEQTEQFIDHHRHKGTLGLDWVRGWQTWMRNAVAWGRFRPAATATAANGHTIRNGKDIGWSNEQIDAYLAEAEAQGLIRHGRRE